MAKKDITQSIAKPSIYSMPLR